MNKKPQYCIIKLALAAVVLPFGLTNAADLQFNGNPNNEVGKSPGSINVAPGSSFTLSVQVVLGPSEPASSLDYWLWASTSGLFSITNRDLTGSDFPDGGATNAEVTSTGDANGDGKPDNQLSPVNGVDLGTGRSGGPPVTNGTFQVANFTLQLAANAAPGMYEIRTFDYAGFGINDVTPAHQASIFIVVPEPSAPPGHWEIADSPSPSTLYNYLIKVTCVSANNCWAVGSYWNGTNDQALIEHYDGTSWSVVASPSPGPTSGSYLVGITCLNANACWAVGSYSVASTGTVGFGNYPVGEQPLIEYWDGTAWSIVTSPPGPPYTTLRGVSCVSATDCWAVGHYGGEVIQTFVEHYDGVVWSIVSSPNPPSPNASLYAISCPAANDCWAVGEFFNTVPATCGDSQTVSTESLVEHYDGVAWSIVNAPYDPCKLNLLDKITCLGSGDCWAVGTKSTDTSTSSTLIQHYDGAAWSIVESPNTDATLLNYLYGVTCASASDCWAVGLHDIGGTNYRPTIVHYDGAMWSIVDSPVDDTTYRLDDVTCVNSNDCWAVGIHNQGHTLIEHYTVPVPLDAVLSRKAHGSAGTFDVDLPLTGNPGIECRSGGANGDYTLIFTFANPLTSVGEAHVTSGTGNVSNSAIDGSDPHQYVVNLTGLTNAQIITVSLTNVNDSAGNRSSLLSATMGALVGDVTANGTVSNTDVASVKGQVAAAVTASNFRNDVTANGLISNTDVSATKAQVGTSLPTPP